MKFLAAFLLLPALAGAQTPAQVDTLVTKAMAKYRVPGMAVAVVKDGKVLVAKGYGVKEMGKAEKVGERTLFSIASNTKFFTAAALALLVEEGKVRWDAPVVTYLPDFAMYDPWVTKEITVRDLLVHRSGLGLGAGDLLWWPASARSRNEVNARLRFIKPKTSFRSAYAYDNVLYNVAGELIEKVSGQSWEAFVEDRILKKVEMDGSLTRLTAFAKAPDRAVSHADVEGTLQTIAPLVSDVVDPAGGIGSNAVDMAKWLRVHLDGGKGLLKESSERELTSLVTPIPSPWPFSGYALGMGVLDYHGHKLLAHSGGLPGFVSELKMVPDARIGVVVLTNSESPASEVVALEVVNLALGVAPGKGLDGEPVKPIPAMNPTLSPLPADLSEFAGEYEDAWYGAVTLAVEDGKLVVRFAHTPDLVGEVTGRLGERFYVRWRNRELRADALISFVRKDGKIEGATMAPANAFVDFSYDFEDLWLRRK